LLASQTSFANNITSYTDLVSTLKQGNNAYALFDFTKCQKAPGSTLEASLNPRGVNVVDLTINDTKNYAGKPMKTIAVEDHGYVGRNDFLIYRSLYRFLEDNTVEVVDDTIDPVTYKLKDRMWLVCRMTADNSGGVAIINKK
jgi:hypothetical protein